MANRTNQATTPETQETTTPETQETTAPVEHGEKQTEDLVDVFIPKTSRSDNERFVAVNGERILIQTGKTVAVPRRFAEVIKNSMASDAEAAAYIEANVSV